MSYGFLIERFSKKYFFKKKFQIISLISKKTIILKIKKFFLKIFPSLAFEGKDLYNTNYLSFKSSHILKLY